MREVAPIGSSAGEAVAVEALLRGERERIAAIVEERGCGMTEGCEPWGPTIQDPYRSENGYHGHRCPIAIAAAIRRGDL